MRLSKQTPQKRNICIVHDSYQFAMFHKNILVSIKLKTSNGMSTDDLLAKCHAVKSC